MTIIKRFCDHCGKRIGAYCDCYLDYDIEVPGDKLFRVDLCPSCGDELNNIVNDFVNLGKNNLEKDV